MRCYYVNATAPKGALMLRRPRVCGMSIQQETAETRFSLGETGRAGDAVL